MVRTRSAFSGIVIPVRWRAARETAPNLSPMPSPLLSLPGARAPVLFGALESDGRDPEDHVPDVAPLLWPQRVHDNADRLRFLRVGCSLILHAPLPPGAAGLGGAGPLQRARPSV